MGKLLHDYRLKISLKTGRAVILIHVSSGQTAKLSKVQVR